MQAEKLAQVKTTVLKLRQRLIAGELYQSLPERVGLLIEQAPTTPLTTVAPTNDQPVLALIKKLKHDLQADGLDEIKDADLQTLLTGVGSVDPKVRDRGVRYLLNEAVQLQLLRPDQLGAIFDYLVTDDVLFAHIDQPTNDAVFQRSYAIVLLSLLVYVHYTGLTFLTDARIQKLVAQTNTYLVLEQDTRGFVQDKGWAHAYTHLGNLLEQLADEPSLTRADKLLTLAIFISRYQHLKTPLIFGEAERLSMYLAVLASKDQLYTDYILLAFKKWRTALVMGPEPDSYAAWTQVFNRNRLMEAMALHDDLPDALVDYLDDELEFLG
ncbi:DUF2785 domain-containing protein [Lactiplantibacillus modestisalitolerans]|uniref:DUF2785 domain-containing protein n=1 Tax=Lactiplantibacillus modestisalitolerans TaxID=1457219 RepID=A0ABV5WW26_9LACO|nr:DUF2785 domain-containing protein [Lactiplantibacillus modestisalitolerans]